MLQSDSKYPFTNLVFEGGGVLGIAYLGMLQELSDRKILGQIERVGGSSAGAIAALAVSFGLDVQAVIAMADSLDYSKVPQTGSPSLVDYLISVALNLSAIPVTAQEVHCLRRLFAHQGWYSSEYFYGWLQTTIASQFDASKKKPPYTFADFQDSSLHKDGRKFLDLCVTGANISTHEEKIFSFVTTPDVEVATAVRISMSIPLFFTPVDFQYPPDSQESTFSDGGTMLNYPISLFDSKTFGGDDKTNYKTLGGHLCSNKTISPQPITSLVGYVKNVFASLMAGQSAMYQFEPEDVFRTIDIDNLGISFVDFDIKPHDQTYNALFASGQKSAKSYLDNYSPINKPVQQPFKLLVTL